MKVQDKYAANTHFANGEKLRIAHEVFITVGQSSCCNLLQLTAQMFLEFHYKCEATTRAIEDRENTQKHILKTAEVCSAPCNIP